MSFSDAGLSPEVSAHRDDLIAQALELGLHEDPYWRLLGHYRPRWVGGYKSLIDDPDFFCAPGGKFDPRAELVATLVAWFEPEPEDPEVRHAVCRFPARYGWLEDRLAVQRELLPEPECEDLIRVLGYLKPSTLTLVFPAAYMNSPASMFGHTLLVFDGADQNRLLAKGVGYAAAVTTGIGPIFAIKGIFGLYPGRFAVEDYFDKVETYNDIHRRDIWEYELDFTREEVERVFLHAWELQNIWSWYYFFDENCAYKLYQLIDAARPGLSLSDDPSWFVIPIDTVKKIVEADLVREASFRPSKATRLTQMMERLSPEVGAEAMAVASGRESAEILARRETLPLAERRLALDVSADYAQFLFTERILDRETYSQRYIGILRERSKLGPREEDEFVIQPPLPPESGHDAAMLGPGVGTENGDFFLTLKGRIAYHGLLDNDTGFTRGAQITFLNSEARWRPHQDKVELRFVDIVHVESIVPRNVLFSPVSWRARLGFTQMDRRAKQDAMIFHAQTGGGAAWEPHRDHLVWVLFESELHVSDRYRHNLAAGPGASLGWMMTPAASFKLLMQARTVWMVEREDDWWRVEAGVGVDHRLSRNQSLRLTYHYTANHDYEIHETGLSWNRYF